MNGGLTKAATQSPDASITITLPYVAKLLNISETLARHKARAGRVPGAFKIGRRWVVHRATFEEGIACWARGVPFAHEQNSVAARALGEAHFRSIGTSHGR
jgi:hypothetical protein